MSVWSQTVRTRQTVYQPVSATVRTVILTSVLTSIYAAYSTWITPHFMQKQSRAQMSTGPVVLPSNLTDNVAWAKKYLADHPWTFQPGYQFRTPQAFVYTKSWQQLENGDILFEPFALIWRREGEDGEDEPIRVVSEKARITFARSFDLSDPDPGRVVKGTLEGKVEILGGDGLVIAGKDFHFSEHAKLIWSDHPVKMQQGPNRGRAERMDIFLITNVVNENDDHSAIAGFRAVKFSRDIQLDVVANADGPGEGTPIRIECEESLVYDVPSSVARFEGTVIVQRESDDEHVDELHCDELKFFFKPQSIPAGIPPADALAETEPTPPENELPIVTGIDSGLTLDRIHADGEDVWLYSDANQMSAKMKTLVYHLTNRTIAMTDPKLVEVRVGHPASRLNSPRIELKHDEAGTIVSALCDGAGTIDHKNADGRTELKAHWKKRLRLFPDQLSGLRVLELEGQARVKQPQRKMLLDAETIRAWIHGDFASDAFATPASRSEPVADASSDAARDIQIERLLALKDVIIVSPQLQGITQRLEVLFDRSSEQSVPETRLGSRRPLHDDRLARDRLQLTSHSGSARATDKPLSGKLGDLGSQPLNLRAERTRVHLRYDDVEESYTPSQIFTTGNVLVTQASEDGKTRELEITGTALSIVNAGPDQEVLHVEGQPAQIRRQQIVLEGGNITFDRGQNRSTVDGAGRLLMPIKNGIDGSKQSRPGRLEVRWQEQMDFDGLLARFFGQVQAHQHHDIMRCQQMEVTLSSRVSFTEPRNKSAETPGVKNLRCIDGVEVESSEYEGSRLLSIRRARVWDFKLDHATGDTEALGPGYITVWQRDAGKRTVYNPSATVLANRATKADNAEWQYTRIDFFGKSVGNFNRRNTTFYDRVEIVYGPVHHPLETIDPDNLGPDGGWMRCHELQVAQVQLADDGPSHIELLAKGNAELDGRSTRAAKAGTFHGLADQISFDQSKGLYMLRSLGQHNATLWRQSQSGGKQARTDATRMTFIPEKNQLEFDKTTSLDLVQ